jgi:dTDP-4-amino-4,6-dideoxygalactose transaminase
MAHPAYNPVIDFERALERYTGATYAIAVDNCSNALFLSLMYEGVKGKELTFPKRTYMSAVCSAIHAGAKINFNTCNGPLKGAYNIEGSRVWDSALSFTKDLWDVKGFPQDALVCLSFSGPRKHLKLGKGGAILTHSQEAMEWFKLARYSGRHEVSHESDTFAMVGWNFYMLPEIAARGNVLMMDQGHNGDLSFHYQDLSKYEIYTKANR